MTLIVLTQTSIVWALLASVSTVILSVYAVSAVPPETVPVIAPPAGTV